jgi:hypothetical protein
MNRVRGQDRYGRAQEFVAHLVREARSGNRQMNGGNKPVHLLRDRLETARVKAIEALASQDCAVDRLPANLLSEVAELHVVLMAVREEIERHEPREGYGSERPLG